MNHKLETAFKKVVNTHGLLTGIDKEKYTKAVVADFKRRKVPEEKMREVLKDAGWVCVSQERWSNPNN